MKAKTNKNAWLIDRPNCYILKGSIVEIIDELDEAYVVYHSKRNCLVRKEDVDLI